MHFLWWGWNKKLKNRAEKIYSNSKANSRKMCANN